jgi:predicted acylesterase/phospholipase RssA
MGNLPGDVDVVGLSGTSGGAICAALAWDGLVRATQSSRSGNCRNSGSRWQPEDIASFQTEAPPGFPLAFADGLCVTQQSEAKVDVQVSDSGRKAITVSMPIESAFTYS